MSYPHLIEANTKVLKEVLAELKGLRADLKKRPVTPRPFAENGQVVPPYVDIDGVRYPRHAVPPGAYRWVNGEGWTSKPDTIRPAFHPNGDEWRPPQP